MKKVIIFFLLPSRTLLSSVLLIAAIMQVAWMESAAKDIIVTGRVTTVSGSGIPYANITIVAGSIRYGAVTSTDGSYSLKISGIYSDTQDQLELGTAHPNPFTFAVNIPFIISTSGDIGFSVYSLSGQKIKEISFKSVAAGSYRIIWDGSNDNGTPVRQGLYIYAITFRGNILSGKVIKAPGFSTFSSSTTLEPVMLPPVTPAPSNQVSIPVITEISSKDYYDFRQTDIILRRDTIIDFSLGRISELPFKTQSDHIAMFTDPAYRPLVIKGINLGASTPGTFPGEIAYAIPGKMYEEWIKRIGKAGFNSIRVYTLHPPVFYEKLANYNNQHPENPVLLFQGVWLEEVAGRTDPTNYDLFLKEPSFLTEAEEVIDCIHGNRNIAFRPGKAYGNYQTDVSRWTAGYIIGREIDSYEVEKTNSFHPASTSYTGNQFSISGASATDVFVTRMLDRCVEFEALHYSVRRPVSISSWPTLDPLTHPTEIHTDEDKASFNISKISGKNLNAGLFATYHAYPYYPNFISEQPSYRLYSDGQGANSYLGYLDDLRNHYSGIPLVIGEFGVPSSWGSAHQSYSNMHHGGYSEIQQGEKNIRLMHNIVDAGCAGGFMFSWMDEWFKPTWIVGYLEAFGFFSDNVLITTRQLWHNLTSPEQNFGLVTFEENNILPFISYQRNNTSGPVKKIEATNDNSYFFLNIETVQPLTNGDTVIVAFDTYSRTTGESRLINGKQLINRSEFLLSMVLGSDTALHHVTPAYDMYGLTPNFNLSDPLIQKYRSTVTDGVPWRVMQWINDEFSKTVQDIGRLPIENSTDFTSGHRRAVAWSSSRIKVRIPWTLLYYHDPTRMHVIDGATSYDGGYSFAINTVKSDGIAVSVYYKGIVTSTTDRYTWNNWLVVPSTKVKEKASLGIVENGLKAIPGFAD